MLMKQVIFCMIACITLLLMSCSPLNAPDKDTGSVTIENKYSYSASAFIYFIEGDNTKRQVMSFDIPPKGSVTQTLEVGKYQVFAVCNFYYIQQNFTITKGSAVTISLSN